MFKDSKLVGKSLVALKNWPAIKSQRRRCRSTTNGNSVLSNAAALMKLRSWPRFHDRIRRGFGYKRKEFEFTNDGAVASIKTPDFDLNVTLTQDPEDAERYLLRTEAVSFRRPEVVEEPPFLETFAADFSESRDRIGRRI